MHLSEDELILYFYGESRRAGLMAKPGKIDRHLEECVECAALYREIASTLTLVSRPDTPLRGEDYGAEVWQRIRRELPEQERADWLSWLRGNRLVLAAATAALVVLAFAAGRFWPTRPRTVATTAESVKAGPDAGERVRLAALDDHLEQSERVLLDVVNAQGSPINVSDQQAWASALVDSNRLYRDAAVRAGDVDVADVLDDLERSLLDIVHGPSTLTPAQLDAALVHLDAAALLFKVRVLADELHERETAPVKSRSTI